MAVVGLAGSRQIVDPKSLVLKDAHVWENLVSQYRGLSHGIPSLSLLHRHHGEVGYVPLVCHHRFFLDP